MEPDAATAPCTAPSGASAQAVAALQRANEVRAAMGVGCQSMIREINTSAQRHCEYYSANSGACVADAHSEVSTCAMYVATNFADRMGLAGYQGEPAAEDMHFVGDGQRATQGWIDSVWHRTPVLSPWVGDIGYGNTADCDTMDFGRGAQGDYSMVAMYPYADQTGVPIDFAGDREGPSPPAPPTGWPSGYPITLYTDGLVRSHSLRVDGSTVEIDHMFIAPSDPAGGLLDNDYVLYAYAPLTPSTRYHVTVSVIGSTGVQTIEWTFVTAP